MDHSLFWLIGLLISVIACGCVYWFLVRKNLKQYDLRPVVKKLSDEYIEVMDYSLSEDLLEKDFREYAEESLKNFADRYSTEEIPPEEINRRWQQIALLARDNVIEAWENESVTPRL